MATSFIRALALDARVLVELEHLLARRREPQAEGREPSVPLPADYRVEIRERQRLAVG